jgi:hypothetical protein
MVELEPLGGGLRRRFRLDRPVLAGDLLLGRFCEIDDVLVVVGSTYRFDADLEADLVNGMAENMEMGDRLRWFDERLSTNPVRSDNGERRVLITAVLEPADVAAFDAWLGPAAVTDGSEAWPIDPRADHDQPNSPTLQRADATHYLLLLPTESSRERFLEDLDGAGLDVAWEGEVTIPVTEGLLAEAARDADF